MRRCFILIFILSFNFTVMAQQDPLKIAREAFQNGTEEALKKVLALPVSPENTVVSAYQGASKARMAEFVSNPITKVKYFNSGKAMLEESIAKKKDPESAYLRLMIQLNAPGFLNYHKNIAEDLDYFNKNIGKSDLPPATKAMFVSNLKKGNKHKHDLSSLDALKFY